MKNGIQSLTYSVAEPKTYLTVTMKEGCVPLRFCISMAERNQIPGILPVSQEFEDGHTVLYHDITGKRRLTDMARDMGEDAFLKVLGDLCQDLQGLPDYFLRSAHCLLDASQTYVDRYGEAFLPLVPMADDAEDSAPLLREYFMGLLGACVPAGGVPSPRLSPFLGYMFQPTFRLEEFAELFGTKKQQPAQPPYTPPVTPPPVTPPPVATPPQPPKPPVTAPPAPTPPQPPVVTPPAGGGIKIPGGGGIVLPPTPPAPPKPDKKAKKDAKKEAKKDEKKRFGIFGKKPADDKVDMEKQALMISDKMPIPPAKPNQPPVYTPPSSHTVPPSGYDYPPAGGAAGGGYPPAGGGPVGGGPAGGGDRPWTGTIQLDTAGTTALFDQTGTPTAVLIHAGKRIVLSDFPFSLGRLACRYTINNPKVSRTHATITQQGNTFYIQDENSANHTYVNGTMLPPYTPVPLEAGCEIRLGNEYFQFQLEGM